MILRRHLELWEPPHGYRLASVVATTYELDADFFEEDLLPVAFGLQLSPARGRDFRLELEHALEDTEVSIFFHPGRYQPGLRRSPRIDLLPLPEGPYPKLHAKITLLRFVAPASPQAAKQIVRLLVGSANLTGAGYRSNIEVLASMDHTLDASAEVATAVRDAVNWLEEVIGPSTDQVGRQFRDIKAVLSNFPERRQDKRLRFVGLPSTNGFPPLAGTRERVDVLTIVSPFWPSGDDLSDVATALRRFCGGSWRTVKLIGPCDLDERGTARPVIPAALVRALLDSGAKVEVAAADPSYGCATVDDDDDGEFDEVAERRRTNPFGSRSLHAKALLAVSDKTTRLAIGSFNLTRKGLGLVRGGNVEAGLLWVLPNDQSSGLTGIASIGTAWHKVTKRPEEYVVEPGNYDGDGDGEGSWPTFILSLRAKRDELILEGNAATWPGEVVIRMKDIRSRLSRQEQWFDPWTVKAPTDAEGVFSTTTALNASWLDHSPASDGQSWPALPDLEAEVSWNGEYVTLPVVFEDKDQFPVVETLSRQDEQSLVAWFLGLRPADETEDGGFGHSIDPIPGHDEQSSATSDILSYLVRDFVHSLPGIRNRLADAGMTETGLRAALLGHRSPVELARQSLHAYVNPQPDKPRKTAIATAFQLAELQHLLRTAPLPDLADGVSEGLREKAVAEVSSVLDETIAGLSPRDRTEVVRAYLDLDWPQP